MLSVCAVLDVVVFLAASGSHDCCLVCLGCKNAEIVFMDNFTSCYESITMTTLRSLLAFLTKAWVPSATIQPNPSALHSVALSLWEFRGLKCKLSAGPVPTDLLLISCVVCHQVPEWCCLSFSVWWSCVSSHRGLDLNHCIRRWGWRLRWTSLLWANGQEFMDMLSQGTMSSRLEFNPPPCPKHLQLDAFVPVSAWGYSKVMKGTFLLPEAASQPFMPSFQGRWADVNFCCSDLLTIRLVASALHAMAILQV